MENKEIGKLIDEAITCFHLGKKSPKDMPKIVFDKLEAYKKDSRTKNVLAWSVQQYIEFKFDGNIYCGFIDQLRMENDEYRLWDIKYTTLPPRECLHYYLPQLLIYAYALQVKIGGIINMRNYGTNQPVYYAIDYKIPDAKDMACLNYLIIDTLKGK